MNKVYLYIAVMAIVTYIIRVLPFLLIRGKITNVYVRSFLHYIPYATLAAMTFPAVLMDENLHLASCICGFLVALILSYKKKQLLFVAFCACLAAFICENICFFIM